MSFKQKIASFVAAGVVAIGTMVAATTGAHGNHRLGFFATALDLTDAQKATAKSLFQQAATDSKPLRDQLRQEHQLMFAAIKAGKPAEELAQIGNQEGTVMGQLAGIRAKYMEQFYAQLTPQQRDKADQIFQNMANRRQHGRRGAGNASSANGLQ